MRFAVSFETERKKTTGMFDGHAQRNVLRCGWSWFENENDRRLLDVKPIFIRTVLFFTENGASRVCVFGGWGICKDFSSQQKWKKPRPVRNHGKYLINMLFLPKKRKVFQFSFAFCVISSWAVSCSNWTTFSPFHVYMKKRTFYYFVRNVHLVFFRGGWRNIATTTFLMKITDVAPSVTKTASFFFSSCP